MYGVAEMSENFHSRLRVETTYAKDDVRDHRDGFTQQEYFRNQQSEARSQDRSGGFPPMESVTEAPKPKAGTKQRRTGAKADQALQDAVNKDLAKRNVRRRSSK